MTLAETTWSELHSVFCMECFISIFKVEKPAVWRVEKPERYGLFDSFGVGDLHRLKGREQRLNLYVGERVTSKSTHNFI